MNKNHIYELRISDDEVDNNCAVEHLRVWVHDNGGVVVYVRKQMIKDESWMKLLNEFMLKFELLNLLSPLKLNSNETATKIIDN